MGSGERTTEWQGEEHKHGRGLQPLEKKTKKKVTNLWGEEGWDGKGESGEVV